MRKYLNERIKRAHIELKEILHTYPEERKRLKYRLQDSLRDDREKTYNIYRRKYDKKYYGVFPEMFYYYFGTKENHIDIETLITNKLKTKKQIRILDFGAGDGLFLQDLKLIFKDRIETHALTLGDFKELQYKKRQGVIDKVIRRSAESFLPEQEYDLIISYYGGALYSSSSIITLKKIMYSLAPKGIALIYPYIVKHLQSQKELEEISKDNCFTIKSFENGIMIYRKDIKK